MLATRLMAKGGAGGVAPPTDSSFANVLMLLKNSATNGGTNNSFVDSSPSPFTISRNGNPTQGSNSPYGNRWSAQFLGTNASYVNVNPGSISKFGSNDFTIEFWINPDGGGNQYVITEMDHSSAIGQYAVLWLSTGAIHFSFNYTSAYEGRFYATNAGSVPAGKWTHVVIVRNGGTLATYINGAFGSSASVGSNSFWTGSSYATLFGRASTPSGNYFQGYLSNVRIVVGQAVYSGTFTPPTAPLSVVSGTQFLGFQKPYPKDETGLIAPAYFSVYATKFNPFGRASEYSPSNDGSSAYFDGVGDFLSFTGNTNTQLNSGDFTIEFWVNRVGSGDMVILDSGGGQVLELTLRSNNTLFFYDGTTSHTTPANSSYLLYSGMWNHVACTVTSANVLTIYINGKIAYTANGISRGWTQSTWKVGQWWNGAGYDFKGYLSDVRIVKGSLVYTGAFTPPTAPLTAITNTTLLLGFKNANIWDGAGFANFETISGAAVSTTQAKWDASSVSFTGGYLPTAEKAVYNLGAVDFTVEAWVRWTNNAQAQVILEGRSADNTTPWQFSIDPNGLVYWYDGAQNITNIGVTSGAWAHVAVSRVAGVLRIFINGVQGFSGSNSTTANPSGIVSVGGSSYGAIYRFNGFIDEVRITRGVGRYPSAFTPPTSAFPTL